MLVLLLTSGCRVLHDIRDAATGASAAPRPDDVYLTEDERRYYEFAVEMKKWADEEDNRQYQQQYDKERRERAQKR